MKLLTAALLRIFPFLKPSVYVKGYIEDETGWQKKKETRKLFPFPLPMILDIASTMQSERIWASFQQIYKRDIKRLVTRSLNTNTRERSLSHISLPIRRMFVRKKPAYCGLLCYFFLLFQKRYVMYATNTITTIISTICSYFPMNSPTWLQFAQR